MKVRMAVGRCCCGDDPCPNSFTDDYADSTVDSRYVTTGAPGAGTISETGGVLDITTTASHYSTAFPVTPSGPAPLTFTFSIDVEPFNSTGPWTYYLGLAVNASALPQPGLSLIGCPVAIYFFYTGSVYQIVAKSRSGSSTHNFTYTSGSVNMKLEIDYAVVAGKIALKYYRDGTLITTRQDDEPAVDSFHDASTYECEPISIGVSYTGATGNNRAKFDNFDVAFGF